MKAYPESVRFIGVPVISGAWITPSHVPHEEVIVSPLNGIEREEPLDVRLSMPRVPLPRKVAPVAVDPLRNTELTAVTVPVAVVTSTTVGVLNDRTEDSIPPCHLTAK